MSSVIPFDFDGSAVRVVMQEHDPWFVAKDVCDVLGLGNSRETVKRLDSDELMSVVLTSGSQRREMNAVSESGLYSLIFTSRKEEAKRFRKWVTSEVLPALRKHGTYTMPGHDPEPKVLPSAVPEASLRLKQDVRAQAMRAAVQTARISGGDEEDVKRLYAEYCELFAARPEFPQVQLKSVPDGCADEHRLVLEFIEQEMEITDIETRHGPTSLKSQALEVYNRFKDWCRDTHGRPPARIPSQRVFGSVVKRMPGIKQVSPMNKIFYNLVPKN
ncbi:Bro-N domain-containing protein [Maridesulfovibrio sp.]|uniref:BRO-N domain-containing protein n=1 Tax=Maridesulfovibrio sp. TaxID=2795000 RepID=UPI003AFFE0E7